MARQSTRKQTRRTGLTSRERRKLVVFALGIAALVGLLASAKSLNRQHRERQQALAELAGQMGRAGSAASSDAQAPPRESVLRKWLEGVYALPFAVYVLVAAITNLVFGYYTALMLGFRPRLAPQQTGPPLHASR